MSSLLRKKFRQSEKTKGTWGLRPGHIKVIGTYTSATGAVASENWPEKQTKAISLRSGTRFCFTAMVQLQGSCGGARYKIGHN